VVSLGAVQFGQLLSGSVVIESIFSIHGAGYMAWSAIQGNDLPTIQATLLIFSSIFVGLTLFADLLNAWLDPRIRMG
jgi:peptide/nickel transport system permease protein